MNNLQIMEIRHRNNFICYGLLIAALIIVHYVIDFWPDIKMLQNQKALFSWRAIGIIGLLGLASVYLLNLSGLKSCGTQMSVLKIRYSFPLLPGFSSDQSSQCMTCSPGQARK
jgi:hypothetical protein